MQIRNFIITLLTIVSGQSLYAQQNKWLKPLEGLNYQIEMQGTVSADRTPLWQNANKHGLSSLEKTNGYLRGSLSRSIEEDADRKWGLGYAIDLVAPYHYTSNVIIQQAFVEARWMKAMLTVGSKEWQQELKNDTLSSGNQTLGINARPVPQVRLGIDYFTIPYTNGWLHMKGHVAYGKMTDDNWQHDFTQKLSKYTDDLMYHSKAGYLKIGNDEVFCPWSLTMGLEMAAFYGGTAYRPSGDGMEVLHGEKGVKGMWHSLIPGGDEVGEETYLNVAGDHLGSWLMRLDYDADSWRIGFYADKYFEDHSAMLQLDYDGYGTGEEWTVKKDRRFLIYDFKDMMLGMELNLRDGRWLQNLVFEYLYSKYQSGPIYHDHSAGISDHIGGDDNFYNHYIYNGWQHWGQVMGNPLYRSPIYNDDGKIEVKDNRFRAFHLGFDGEIVNRLNYRVLGTFQEGFGTYSKPYTRKRRQGSFLTELICTPGGRWLEGWTVRGSYAMDFGSILGNNWGFQLTLTKRGLLGK